MSIRERFGNGLRRLGEIFAPSEEFSALRQFVASRQNRLTADWPLYTWPLENEQQMSLRRLRHRSRWLTRNNDYVRKFIALVQNNIIGTGVTLQVKAELGNGTLDSATNKTVETAWWDWSKPKTASLNQRLSWVDLQRLIVSKLAIDGESLIELVPGAKNRFGFALKIHDVDALDESHNTILPGGNRVVMGVELDADDVAVAYWLTPVHDLQFALRREQGVVRRVRVPAERMLHLFIPESESAIRGVPWLHTAMMRLRMLGAYEEAELVAARIGASKMGAFKKTADDTSEPSDTKLITKVAAGQLIELPPGVELQSLNWDHPNSGYDKFIVAVLHGIASGMLVSYEGLTGDLKGVNYSSIRAGVQTERDVWRGFQHFVIEHLCDPVYEAWFPEAVLSGQVRLAPRKYQAARMPVWRPRGWDYVNPVDEVNAAVTAINNGLSTITDELAKSGKDIEDIAATRAAELKIFAAANIPLAAPKPGPAAASADTQNVPAGDPAQSTP